MINKNDFQKSLSELIDTGVIENKELRNRKVLKYVLDDPKINDKLYKGFVKNYKDEYGNSKEYILMKLQDMLYRLHILISYSFIDKYGVVNKETIRNAISELIDNDEMDFYDAVSYDDTDFEIIDINDFDVRNVLHIRNI